MLTKTFEEKDEVDVEKQILNWKLANPQVKEFIRHPMVTLPLQLTNVTLGKPLPSPNLVSISIDYQITE